MNIEKQVCDIEQSKKLKDFGIEQDGHYCYLENSASKIDFGDVNYMFERHIQDYEHSVHPDGFDGSFKEQSWIAYTGTELGAMIGNYSSLKIDLWQGLKDIWLARVGFKELVFSVPNEARARAELLIYLLQNEILSAETCNKRLVE
jgi:hypothetical protein